MSDDHFAQSPCPKCGWPRAATACPKCGLIYERFDPSAIDADVPEAIIELWRNTENDWTNPARHAVFVEQALHVGCGGYAAARYRARGDDAVAIEQLQKLTKRLENRLLATAMTRPSAKPTHPLVKLLLFVIFAAIGGLVSYWLISR